MATFWRVSFLRALETRHPLFTCELFCRKYPLFKIEEGELSSISHFMPKTCHAMLAPYKIISSLCKNIHISRMYVHNSKCRSEGHSWTSVSPLVCWKLEGFSHKACLDTFGRRFMDALKPDFCSKGGKHNGCWRFGIRAENNDGIMCTWKLGIHRWVLNCCGNPRTTHWLIEHSFWCLSLVIVMVALSELFLSGVILYVCRFAESCGTTH